jgi:hypothetical protein
VEFAARCLTRDLLPESSIGYLLSIDPTMGDKLGAARDLADLMHTTAMPVSQDNQRQTRTR